MLHKVFAPHLNQHVVVGGARPVHLGARKHAHFEKFIADLSAIVVPTTTSFRTAADKSLRKMYLNDSLGDCVIAARNHRLGVLTGNATGTPVIATDAQIKSEYHDIGGYDGTPATDQGCDMIVAADYGVSTGYIDGSKDLGYLIIDATNKDQVKLAMFVFEDLDIAIPLPDAWISPFPSADGFTWDVTKSGSNPNNGHCIPGIDIATNGIMVDSWTLEGVITFPALADYAVDKVGGCILVHLNPDMLAKAMAKAPNGIDWAAILSEFNALGGSVPVPPQPVPPSPTPPAPSPAPVPAPPAPAPVVTLAEAKAAVAAAFKKGGALTAQITRKHATEIAETALTGAWK
jgi:hypothetical protein